MSLKRAGLAAFVVGLAIAVAPSFAGTAVTGFAPYQSLETSTGAFYNADGTGTVTGVASGSDLRDLLANGGRTLDSALAPAANGLFPMHLPLLQGRNGDGTAMAVDPVAATNKFGASVTLGTSEFLFSESANSDTKTDTVLFEVVLPRNYIAGRNITLTANAQYVLGSGTVGTHTLTCHAYRTAPAGTLGADLVATGALTVPTTATDLVSVITGTTLLPNDRMIVACVAVIQDTGGSNITAQINSLKLS